MPFIVPKMTVLPAATVVDNVDVGTISVPLPLLLMATVPTDVPLIDRATLVPSSSVSPVTLITDSDVPSKLPVWKVTVAVSPLESLTVAVNSLEEESS